MPVSSIFLLDEESCVRYDLIWSRVYGEKKGGIGMYTLSANVKEFAGILRRF